MNCITFWLKDGSLSVIFVDPLNQCFSTFWASSLGKSYCLGQKYLLRYWPNNISFSTQKHKIDASFILTLVQNLVLLTKFNNLSVIQGGICKFWIFKNITSPGKNVSKCRYRDPSRRLRNTALDNWVLHIDHIIKNEHIPVFHS